MFDDIRLGKYALALRPVLRSVEYPRDFNRVVLDLIHGDVGQRRKGKLAPSGHAAAGASHVRKVLQLGATVIDYLGNAPSGFRVIAFYPRANAFEVFGGGQRPANFHQGCRKRLSRSPTCSWVRNSPRSNAASPRFTASTNRSSSSK